MAITQAVANSFKKELLEGEHTFQFSGGDTFKLALYTSAATLNSTTTVYATNPGGGSNTEVPNSGEYAAVQTKQQLQELLQFSFQHLPLQQLF